MPGISINRNRDYPCIGCTNRHIGCHTDCEKFCPKDCLYKKKREEAIENRDKSIVYYTYKIEQMRRDHAIRPSRYW